MTDSRRSLDRSAGVDDSTPRRHAAGGGTAAGKTAIHVTDEPVAAMLAGGAAETIMAQSERHRRGRHISASFGTSLLGIDVPSLISSLPLI